MKKLYLLLLFSCSRLLAISQCMPPEAIATAILSETPNAGVACIGEYFYYLDKPMPIMGGESWSVNGGGTITSPYPYSGKKKIQWTTPGNYIITVQINAGCGLYRTLTLPVTVANGIQPSTPGVISGSTYPCAGIPTEYSVQLVNGMSYQWYVNNTLVGTNTNTVNLNFPVEKSEILNVFAVSGSCISSRSQKYILPLQIPETPLLSGAQTACINSSVTYTATSSRPSGADQFTWSLPNGGGVLSSVNGTPVTIQWTEQGTFPIHVIENNGCGISPIAIYTVTVGENNTLVPGAITSPQASTICYNSYGTNAIFNTSPVANATEYIWEITKPPSSYVYQTFNTSTPGLNGYLTGLPIDNYTITVRVSNGYCKSDPSAPYTFSLITTPSVSTINTSAVACAGQQKMFSVNQNNIQNSSYTYTWDVYAPGTFSPSFPTGALINGESVRRNYSTANNSDQYSVTFPTANTNWTVGVRISNQCGSNYNTIEVPVTNTSAQITQIPQIQGSTDVCKSNLLQPPNTTHPIVFSYSVPIPTGSGNISYVWDLPNGGASFSAMSIIETSTTNSPQIVWIGDPGNYSVRVRVYNQCGLLFTSTLPVVIKPGASPAIRPSLNYNNHLCPNNEITFFVVNPEAGVSYQWEVDGELSMGPSLTKTFSTWGTKSVVVTPKNGSCDGQTNSILPTINQRPSASISSIRPICEGSTMSVINLTSIIGSPNQYSINWYSDALSNGLVNVVNASFTSNNIAISGLPLMSGTFSGELILSNTFNPCLSDPIPFTITIEPRPRINLGSIPPVCSGTFYTSVSYSVIQSSPNYYMIDWDANTNAAGLPDKSLTSLSENQITLQLIATPGTYSGKLYVRNSVTECDSDAIPITAVVNALAVQPTISPTGPTSFCQGGSVILNTSGATGVTYQWKYNNAIIAGATEASYTATIGGQYSVTITNTHGCSTTSSLSSVNVIPLPSPPIYAGATTFCEGSQTNIQISNAYISYQWNRNGNPISGATTYNYFANQSGSYTVTVTNSYACTGTSAPATITVNPKPVTTITPNGSTSICSGSSVQLQVPTGTGYTYQWRKNGIEISGASAPTYTAAEAGSYSIYISTPAGCSATSVGTNVTVNSLPSSTISISGATTFCAGGSVTLNANTGTGLSYQWYKDGSPLASITTSSYPATTSGSYSVQVTNASGCSKISATVPVLVNNLPLATITPAGTTIFCNYSGVNLQSSTSESGTYQWRKNGNNISGATSANYYATTDGNYSLQVTTAAGCSSISNITTLVSETPPQVSINSNESSITVCSGSNVTLTANATGNNLTYSWFKGSNLMVGETHSSLTFTVLDNAADYSVNVVSPVGCVGTRSMQVQATNNYDPQILASPFGGNPIREISENNYMFCEGAQVSLQSDRTYQNYQWRKDGVNIPGATNRTFTASTPGMYSVFTTANLGCTKLSHTVALTQSARPAISLNYTGTITKCVNESIQFETQNHPGNMYQWLKNGNSVSGESANTPILTIPSVSSSASGVYKVLLINEMGCQTFSPEVTLVVNSTIPPASIESQIGNVCSPTGIELRANTGTNLAYQWKLNGAEIPNAISSNYFAKISGSYSVKVSQSGCSRESNQRNLTVSTPLQVSIQGPEAMCNGSSVNLVATVSTSDGQPVNLSSYTTYWNAGTPTADPTVRLISGPSTYTFRVTSPEYGCQYSAAKTVANYGTTKPVVQRSGDICLTNSVTLTSSEAGAYLWSTGATTRSITASPSQTYTVRTFSVNGGCQSGLTSFYVEPCSMSSQFSYYAKEETEVSNVGIYPNPVDQELIITLPKAVEKRRTLLLVDQLGKVVSETHFEKGEQKKQVSTVSFTSGIYLLKLEADQGILTKKIMIIHRQ